MYTISLCEEMFLKLKGNKMINNFRFDRSKIMGLKVEIFYSNTCVIKLIFDEWIAAHNLSCHFKISVALSKLINIETAINFYER